MAKGTISMKRFRSNLTKISRLAKSGYNSITSVAKQIIDTVTTMASKISILGENAVWYPDQQISSVGNYQSYYDEMLKLEEKFLAGSLNNLENYKDGVIADIYKISDAANKNNEELTYTLTESIRSAFKNAAADFFDCGYLNGTSYGSGFKRAVEKSMSEVRSSVLKEMQDIYSVTYGVKASGTSSVIYNSPSYNFYGSAQTITQQLAEARKTATIEALRRD